MRVFITGSDSGIGFATALKCLSRGYTVIGTTRDIVNAKQKNTAIRWVEMDCNNDESIEQTINNAIDIHGAIDVVFANAGFGIPGAVEDITTDALRHQFQTNVISTHHLIRCFLKRQGHEIPSQIIVNSSVLGFFPAPYRGAYVASKFAIEGLMASLEAELRRTRSNVLISIYQPGPVITNFRSRAAKEHHKWVTPSKRYKNDYEQMYQRLNATEWGSTAITSERAAEDILHLMQTKQRFRRANIGTHVAWYLRRILPTALMDRIISHTSP